MSKLTAVIMAIVLCISAQAPLAAFADEDPGAAQAPVIVDESGTPADPGEAGSPAEAEGSGEETTAAEESACAVADAFRVKVFRELNADGELMLPETMANVKMEDLSGSGSGLLVTGPVEELTSGRITIADDFNFSEKPEGRETDVQPVGRISLDGLSDKKAKVRVGIYLDDETEPRASMLLKKQMGKTGWAREGDKTVDVFAQGITGKHTISIGFTIDGVDAGKKTSVLLRSLTFCESSVPVMYFNIDESESSIDAMNASADHSVECYGSVTLQVPDGYTGEFSKKELKTQEDMELEYVRGRGNSTWDMDKNPYKVKFDKKQNLLGMGKNKHWILLANRYDNTLLRNRITYWIVRYLGIEYAIKCAPVEVIMNDRYLGSYLLSEQVRVGENRVDIPALDETISDPDSIEITGGYLLNLGGYEDEPPIVTDRGETFAFESPDFSDYTNTEAGKAAMAAQTRYISKYVADVENAIFGDGLKNADGKHYSELLDEDSAVDYWWIQEFSINGDAFGGGSNYMYKKRDSIGEDGTVTGKLYWGPLWDFDFVAWGNPNADADTYESFNNTRHSWMNKLRADDEFIGRLKARWSEAEDSDKRYGTHLQDALTEVVREGGVLDQYYEEVRVSEYYDHAKYGFYNMDYGDYDYNYDGRDDGEQDQEQGQGGENEDGLDEDQDEAGGEHAQTFESEVEQLRGWIKLRQSWVDENIEEIKTPSYTVKFWLDGKVVETRSYTEDDSLGEFPEAPARDEYTFIGWFDGDGWEVSKDTSVYEDTDIYGKYAKTSSLTRARNIFFDTYDFYTYYLEDDEDRFTPSYKLMPENSMPEDIIWSVDDPAVADVNENGGVLPKKPGKVKVTAKLPSGASNSYYITFVEDELWDVESISLNKASLTLKAGAYEQLIVDRDPKPFYTSSLEWFTVDPDIVSVDSFGIVRAKKPGKATVIVIDTDSRCYAVCRVKVTATKAYRIKAARAAKVKAVKAKALKKGGRRSVKISWKKVSGVSGYYVLRAAKKNGKYKKAGTVKKARSVKWTDRKVKAGKTYFYKVQPFTKIGKKTYKGKLSAAAKVKVR